MIFVEWNWCVRRGSRKRGTMCIIKRIAERRVERTSDATISVYLVSHVAVVALPEALDDSEEDTALVLAGVGAHDERLAAAEQLAASDLALGALQSEGDLLGLLRRWTRCVRHLHLRRCHPHGHRRLEEATL